MARHHHVVDQRGLISGNRSASTAEAMSVEWTHPTDPVFELVTKARTTWEDAVYPGGRSSLDQSGAENTNWSRRENLDVGGHMKMFAQCECKGCSWVNGS